VREARGPNQFNLSSSSQQRVVPKGEGGGDETNDDKPNCV